MDPNKFKKKENIDQTMVGQGSEKINGLQRGVTYESELVRGVTYETELVRGVMYESELCDEEPEKLSKVSEFSQMNFSDMVVERINVAFWNNLNATLPPVTVTIGTDEHKFEETAFGNFSLALCRRVIHVQDTEQGENFDCSYLMAAKIHMSNGNCTVFEATVPSDKVKGVEWLKKCTHSLAKTPRDKEEKEAYEVLVQACIERNDVPTEIIYPTAGWRRVPNLGWRFVYGAGIVGEKSSLIHTANFQGALDVNFQKVNSREVFGEAMRMQEICRNTNSSLELLLFVHAAVISTMFEEAGYPLNFLFGIIGITNSRKTSLATTLAQVFDRIKLVADAEFATATDCGIEKVLGKYRDGIVIVDDFKPGINHAQKQDMNKKLDVLARLIGNRVPKKRMTDFMANGNQKFFPITAACVITMELLNAVTSSMSRMFITEIDGNTVDNEKLAHYQKERWILPTHLYSFLEWSSNRFEINKDYIEKRLPELRKTSNYEFGRYAEMYATLMVTAEIITFYAQDFNFWSFEFCKSYLFQVNQALVDELNKMGERAKKSDKSEVVKRALQDAFLTGKIQLTTLSADNSSLRLDCYQDDTRIYLRKDFARKIANDFCRSNYVDALISEGDEILDLIEKIDLLETKMTTRGRERTRKLPIQQGNSLRYLYLPKDKIKLIFEE